MNNYNNNYLENNASLQAQRTSSNASKDTSSSKHRDNQIYLSNWNRTFPQVTVTIPKSSSQTKTISYDPVKFAALKQALMKPKTPKSGMEIFAEHLANTPEAQGFKGGFGEDIYNPYGLILGGLMRGLGQGYSQRKAAEREAADRQNELALRLAQMDYENSKVENLDKKEDEIKTLNQGSTGQGFSYFTVDENGNVKEVQVSDEDVIGAGLGTGTGKDSAKAAQSQYEKMVALHNNMSTATPIEFENANKFAGQFGTNQYDPSNKQNTAISRFLAGPLNPSEDYGYHKSKTISNEARQAENVLAKDYGWNLDEFQRQRPDLAKDLDVEHAKTTAFEHVKSVSLPLISKFSEVFKPMSDPDVNNILQGAGLDPTDTAENREYKMTKAIIHGSGLSAAGVNTFADLAEVGDMYNILKSQRGTEYAKSVDYGALLRNKQSMVEPEQVQQQTMAPVQTPTQTGSQFKAYDPYSPTNLSNMNYGGVKVKGGYVFD